MVTGLESCRETWISSELNMSVYESPMDMQWSGLKKMIICLKQFL